MAFFMPKTAVHGYQSDQVQRTALLEGHHLAGKTCQLCEEMLFASIYRHLTLDIYLSYRGSG